MSYHVSSVGEPDCNPPLRYSLQVKVQVSGVLVGLDSQKVIAIRAVASLRDRDVEPIILRRISLQREEGREEDGGGSTWLGCSTHVGTNTLLQFLQLTGGTGGPGCCPWAQGSRIATIAMQIRTRIFHPVIYRASCVGVKSAAPAYPIKISGRDRCYDNRWSRWRRSC